jgi:hypothetical protein
MSEKRLARDIVVAIISAAVLAAGGVLWNWMSEGGLIRALGGVTRGDLNLAADPRTEACVRYAGQLAELNETDMFDQQHVKQIRSAMAALGCSTPKK